MTLLAIFHLLLPVGASLRMVFGGVD